MCVCTYVRTYVDREREEGKRERERERDLKERERERERERIKQERKGQKKERRESARMRARGVLLGSSCTHDGIDVDGGSGARVSGKAARNSSTVSTF